MLWSSSFFRLALIASSWTCFYALQKPVGRNIYILNLTKIIVFLNLLKQRLSFRFHGMFLDKHYISGECKELTGNLRCLSAPGAV